MHAALAAFTASIRQATERRTPLCIRGGGTKDFYGETPRGEPLDTRGYSGIVEYDPTELVITARCGTPLAEIEHALGENGQMLGFEPPHFGDGATLGGCVAAGLSGPRRTTAGALRDFVLGASLLNAHGELLRFGGKVMKNVAGYDVSRLLAGSLGTLGLIADISLKVLPRPATEVTLTMQLDQAEALSKLNQWAGKPLPISASAWCSGTLGLRLSGAATAVDAAIAVLSADVTTTRVAPEPAARFWRSVREHTDPYFSGDTPLWRLSVPSTAPILALDGEQYIEWGGALRWLRSHAEAATIRASAERVGGNATLFRTRDKSAGVFHPLPAPAFKIHRALKAEFDPAGIFNPRRMYAEL